MPPHRDPPLIHYIDDLAHSLPPLTKSAFAGRRKSIHHARVTTRRLRAAMDLLSQILPSKQTKPLSHALKQLRRRLGCLRDTDVILEHLHDMASSERASAVVWFQHLLQSDRRKSISNLSQKKLETSISELEHWRCIHRRIRGREDELLDILRASAATQLAAFSEQATSLVSASSPQKTAPWHALRVAGKHLRYTLEMSAAAGHDLPPATAETFKAMQDALGLWHDYAVLSERAMQLAVEQHLAVSDPDLLVSVLALISESNRCATLQLKLFAQVWRSRGRSLTAQLKLRYPPQPR